MSIKISDLTYYYNKGLSSENKALDRINLSISDNSFVGIVGKTGSGKSTLIEHLNGLNIPFEGDVLIDNVNTKDKKSLNEIRKNIGFIFQYPDYQLFSETVLDDIIYGLINRDVDKNEAIKKAYEVSKILNFNLDKYKDASPFMLSGGEKRKVAILGVLITEPKILILDEPTSALDPVSHKEFLELIYKIYKEKKITIILISHNMDDISKYCERVIVLNDGKIISDSTAKDLFLNEKVLNEANLSQPKCIMFAKKISPPLSKNDLKDINKEEDLILKIKELL